MTRDLPRGPEGPQCLLCRDTGRTERGFLCGPCVPGGAYRLRSAEVGAKGGEVGAPRVRGTVGWFHRAKGVGYLIEDGEEDARVAVHFSEIDAPKNRRTLYCGQRVEFRVVETPKGRRARGVRVISEAQEATFNLP